jgi:hypothetical protein
MARPETAARRLTLLSAGFLLLQVSLTSYGPDADASGAGWLFIGGVLLWFVYRKRSRVARGVVIISSLFGAVVYALAAVADPVQWQDVLLVVAWLGQAVPMLLDPVRRHVSTVA